jgi:hypothetical protein
MAGGKGKQGRIGTTGGTLLTQHLLKQKVSVVASTVPAAVGVMHACLLVA